MTFPGALLPFLFPLLSSRALTEAAEGKKGLVQFRVPETVNYGRELKTVELEEASHISSKVKRQGLINVHENPA